MDKIDTVLEILKSQKTDANFEDGYIKWTSIDIDYSINADHIDIEKEKVAWFQTNDDHSELFRIFENNAFYDIKPIADHPGYGCDVYLVEWYKAYLILIYHEKHNVVISAVKDNKIKSFQFYGDQLIRRNDKLYYNNYGSNKYIKILQIPELIELEQISIEDAEKENVVPETLGYLNFLKIDKTAHNSQ